MQTLYLILFAPWNFVGENVTYTGWITYCLISSKPLTEIGNLAFSLSEVPLHDCHYIEGLHLRSKLIKDYIDLVVFHFALLSVLELTPSSQKPPFTCFLGSSQYQGLFYVSTLWLHSLLFIFPFYCAR